MASIVNLTESSITRSEVRPGDVIGGDRVTDVQHDTVKALGERVPVTRFEFGRKGWGDYGLSIWRISVHR